MLKGQIPDELVKEAKGGEVHVDMEDHRQEEFVKPKVKAKPFTGRFFFLEMMSTDKSGRDTPSKKSQ